MTTPLLNAQGVPRARTQTAYMNKAGGGGNTVWYAGCQNQSVFATGTSVLGSLRATPFTLSRPVTLSKISFEVTTLGAAGSVMRVGLYRSTSLTNMYPSSLVVDGGSQDCTSTGVKTTSGLSIQLEAGLYWFAWNAGVNTCVHRGQSSPNVTHLLGALSTTLATLNVGIAVAVAYGALPATFTAAAAIASIAIPVVALEFA